MVITDHDRPYVGRENGVRICSISVCFSNRFFFLSSSHGISFGANGDVGESRGNHFISSINWNFKVSFPRKFFPRKRYFFLFQSSRASAIILLIFSGPALWAFCILVPAFHPVYRHLPTLMLRSNIIGFRNFSGHRHSMDGRQEVPSPLLALCC